MFAEKACTLIKELHRSAHLLPPYNIELTNDVGREIVQLIQEIRENARLNEDTLNESVISYTPTLRVYHSAVQRNLRCLLAYHYNRIRLLRTMRWEFGSILPVDIKSNLSSGESRWFSKYSAALAKYMQSIGDNGGLNLAIDLNPPKALYIEVKCLSDYGRYELSDGSILLLKINSRHFLPRVECEELIRQGIFEHITN